MCAFVASWAVDADTLPAIVVCPPVAWAEARFISCFNSGCCYAICGVDDRTLMYRTLAYRAAAGLAGTQFIAPHAACVPKCLSLLVRSSLVQTLILLWCALFGARCVCVRAMCGASLDHAHPPQVPGCRFLSHNPSIESQVILWKFVHSAVPCRCC